MPAKPLIFCALSLRLAVRPPVLFSSLSKYSTEEVPRVGRSDDTIVNASIELTVLSEDGPEAERPYLGCQCRRRSGNHVVLNANGTCRYDGNEEKPKGSAITIMTTRMRVKIGESINTFGENNTIGRKDHAARYS